jgi:hypothetical protein
MMSQWQRQLLKQKLTISEILRVYGKQFTQIAERYSDGHNGRCAIGMIISYHGWNGKDDSNAGRKLLSALVALRYAGVSKELIIRLKQRV